MTDTISGAEDRHEYGVRFLVHKDIVNAGDWVKCVIRTRVRITRWENTCSSKIYALKA